jgi:uncharacterized surface protein with fasciclin (FAS1) repeats
MPLFVTNGMPFIRALNICVPDGECGKHCHTVARIQKENKTMKFLSLAFATLTLSANLVVAAQDPMVGGAKMYANKDIVDNAVNSADHTTLVAAVKAAGLVDTLKGAGPFTVFAPTNEAFTKLPAGTVDTLLKPENKELLTKILTYHVVAGRLSSAQIKKMVKADGGSATLKTVEGGSLTATMDNGDLVLKDEKGMEAHITIANVFQSNGVIHVIDTVLQPN